MGWFSKAKPTEPGNPKFAWPVDAYHGVFERKALPDPGAQNYAWETLGLAPFTPIGPSVRTRQPLRYLTGNIYALKAVTVAGIPLVSGGIVGQPLFDPNAPNGGFVGQSDSEGISPLVAFNIPATHNMPIAPNATNIGRL